MMSSHVQEHDFLAVKENVKRSLLPRSNLMNTYLAAFSALLYIIVLGMVGAFPAPATEDMQNPGSRFSDITMEQITWIASLPTMTSSFGNILSGYFCNLYGRKAVILIVSTPYLLSWLMIIYAPTLTSVYCGRLLVGFCYGMCSVAVPAYLVEISTLEIRGLLAAGYQLGYVIGVLIMVCLGFGLRWSWMAVTAATILTFATCVLYFMPESPQWLVRESRGQDAMKSLKFLRGKNSDFKKEYQRLSCIQENQSRAHIELRSFKNPTLYKPTLIAIALFFFQQFSGINSIISYTVDIFKNSGGDIDPQISTVIFAGVQVIATVCSTALIDKLGRRPLFITSGGLMALSLAVLGIYNVMLKNEFNLIHLEWTPLACLLLYIAAFSFGFGPCAIVVPPEMVPIQYRSTVLAISIVACSIFGFIVTKTFDVLIASIGYYGLYWTYGSFALLGAVFGIFYLPETKGRTVEEINMSFSR